VSIGAGALVAADGADRLVEHGRRAGDAAQLGLRLDHPRLQRIVRRESGAAVGERLSAQAGEQREDLLAVFLPVDAAELPVELDPGLRGAPGIAGGRLRSCAQFSEALVDLRRHARRRLAGERERRLRVVVLQGDLGAQGVEAQGILAFEAGAAHVGDDRRGAVERAFLPVGLRGKQLVVVAMRGVLRGEREVRLRRLVELTLDVERLCRLRRFARRRRAMLDAALRHAAGEAGGKQDAEGGGTDRSHRKDSLAAR